MSLGVYNSYIGTINQGDTAELKAHLRINQQPVTQDQVSAVIFTVQTPTATHNVINGGTLPLTSLLLDSVEGLSSSGSFTVQDTIGLEVLTYTGISGNTLIGVSGGTSGAVVNATSAVTFTSTTIQNGTVQPDGSGFLRWTDTTMLGEYLSICQFVLITGEKRSVITNFSVIDPLNPPQPTPTDIIVEQVMLRLEDCFDSTEGGPWLRDRSMAHFDAAKIASFIPEALLDINVQMPPTNFTLDFFTAAPYGQVNANEPLLVKGVLVLVIRHLMRSYTEIFTPTGQGQLVWPDRTRYQQAWGQIYQIEYADYIAALRLWKRTTLNLGHSALLTLSKAGRLYPFAGQSTRGIYRGYA